ncbi:MAG: Glutamine-hydrolyzing asparagine synthase [uncultured bacterium]|nr:MAG: Glutamine-hydrolyzing asparagine synthase [uncultured bacterium]
MSGIAGIVCFDNRPDSMHEMQKMVGSIAHRGPDGVNCLQVGEASLVNCLLKTTPESIFEKQPLQDDESKYIITADARIDNRIELLDKIGIDKRARENIPDSRIILEAYKKWHYDCPGQLIGDYAFAIWDTRRKELFCARDHIGVRPLFYYSSDKVFIFASEINALLALPGVPNTINDRRVAEYIQLVVGNTTDTYYKNIFRLEPATILVVHKGKHFTKKYWEYNHDYTIKRKDNSEYAQEFKEIFFEAVRCRLRTISPIGCALSGGLDSSSVVCVTRKLVDISTQLHTFSYNFPFLSADQLKKIDERQYQEAILARGDYIHHPIVGHDFAPLSELAVHMEIYGQPFFFPHLYLEMQSWLIAQRNGIHVILNGLDGDLVVSHGYEHLQQLILKGRFCKFYENIKDISRRHNVAEIRLLSSFMFRPYFRDPLAQMYNFLKAKIDSDATTNSIVTEEFSRSHKVRDRNEMKFASLRSAKRCHLQNLTSPLLTDTLELFNIFAARFRVEPRSPFCDRRVMEFCYALPSDQKLKNGWSRYVLREAMQGVIPQTVKERVDKSDLSPGFIHNLILKHDQLIEDVVSHFHPYLSKIVKRNEIKKRLSLFRKHPYDCNRLYHLNLYSLVVLQQWLTQKHKAPA